MEKKYIKPGTKVGLKLTAAERKLILEDLMCLDDDYAQVSGPCDFSGDSVTSEPDQPDSFFQ